MPLFSNKETDPNHIPAPGLPLLALELRAPWEFGAVLPAWPVLQRAPLGDGHTVIVFPGLTAGDATTVPLRRYLDSRNYDTLGWGQGLNLGPRDGVLETAKRQLQEAAQASGGKVSLVGRGRPPAATAWAGSGLAAFSAPPGSGLAPGVSRSPPLSDLRGAMQPVRPKK